MDQVRKEVASHGVAVVELKKGADGQWSVMPGRYNRRITGQTVMETTGPVAGSDFVKTRFDNAGYFTRGTLNDCEITGICATPDGRTIFANIQHPGERGNSTWPRIGGETRPRSATLIITKDDGGGVGT